MFKIFKQQSPANYVPVKTNNKLVEEIHKSFYTEVDRLLCAAKIANSLKSDCQELIDKSIRLKAVGFENAKDVVDAQPEIDRLAKLEKENEQKEILVEAINYFTQKYPQYKFITKASVSSICEKYGLVYGDAKSYIGTIPEKNLQHIECFKVSEEDQCCRYHEIFEGFSDTVRKEYDYTTAEVYRSRNNIGFNGPIQLQIVAPQKDFDMKNKKVVNNKIVPLDPVVLKPVVYKDRCYYLIVTAWGLEAGDELVVNANHN